MNRARGIIYCCRSLWGEQQGLPWVLTREGDAVPGADKVNPQRCIVTPLGVQLNRHRSIKRGSERRQIEGEKEGE